MTGAMSRPDRVSAQLRGVLAAGVLAASALPATALDVLPNEKAGREACERRACDMVLKRDEKGPPLVCDMVKTWDRDKIKKGGEKKRMTWGFGDARCQVSLKLERALVMPALLQDKYTLQFPPQRIVCEIEGSEKKPESLTVVAAPKIKFKDGKADKVWLNVKEVEGQSGVKTLVWTAAKLADGLGFFHKDTIKSINGFLHKTCPDEFGRGKPIEAKAHIKPTVKPTADTKPADKVDSKPVKAVGVPARSGPAARALESEADKTAPASPAKPLKAEAN